MQLDHAVGRAALICTHACVSHHCCVGVGSDATLSTARRAAMSCPLRPAWTEASGSVPQLLLHLQVDWLIHRTVVTEALSVPPPHRPNSFPLLAALSHAHSTRLQSMQQTARSAPWTSVCPAGHSVGKRLSLLRAAATRPCAAAPSTRRLGPQARRGASPALARRLSCGAGPPPAPPRKGVARTAPAGRQRCVPALLGRSASAGAAAVMLRPPSPRSALLRASRRTCCRARCVSP